MIRTRVLDVKARVLFPLRYVDTGVDEPCPDTNGSADGRSPHSPHRQCNDALVLCSYSAMHCLLLVLRSTYVCLF